MRNAPAQGRGACLSAAQTARRRYSYHQLSADYSSP